MHATLQLWLTLGIFGVTLAGILLEKIDKSVLAALGALLYLAFGLISESEIKEFIDFETLSLLMGMMVVVGIAAHSGLFQYLSLRILRVTQGQPLLIFIFFLLNTLILSSFLNNVTTILIVLPLTVEIARHIGLNPRPFVIGEIFMANLGGLLTLIGDPVNTIVGSAAGLSMLDFFLNLGIPVFLLTSVIYVFIFLLHRDTFQTIRGSFLKMLHNQLVIRLIEDEYKSKGFDKRFMMLSSLAMILTIAGFLMTDLMPATPGLIALSGALLSILLNYGKIEHDHIFRTIEWKTLLFFMGLFIMVGAVEKTGVLDQLAHMLQGASDSPAVLLGILLVVTGIVSAFIDNIPFVTIMIPVIRTLQEGPMFAASPEVLWWTLCLGAVIGGMASPFGSSANIVALGVSKQAGMPIGSGSYMRYSLFVSGAGLLISYLYLITAYEL